MLFSSYDFANLCLIAVLAILANMVLGGPRSLYQPLLVLHPARWWQDFIRRMESKLNRSHRERHTRARRGALLTLFAIAILLLIGMMLTPLFTLPYGEYAEILALSLCLSLRQSLDQTKQVMGLLKKAPATIAGELLPAEITRREQTEYDTSTVLRSMIERLALTLQEGGIAPIFYYLLFGWPLVLLQGGMTVMDRLLGYQNRKLTDFGRSCVFVDSLLQWLPARLAGLWLSLAAAFSPAAHPLNAGRTMLAQAGKLQSANAGWPLAAMAGALKITLGGPRSLQGSYIADAWIGEGSSQVKTTHLHEARWLFLIAILLGVMALMLLVVTVD